ncbi:hypothetical protein Golax_020357 [Gossypium laxum]|uniref:Uncharacterized protein n=1 Tax=Gossypium laxum TaxID=34288 RepID=A0A7J9AZI0_9ROSI|nr:hypothetical protein [Gossypium laxum]
MEKWMAILQNLKDEDVEWKAPWLVPDEILYRCGASTGSLSSGYGEPLAMRRCWY